MLFRSGAFCAGFRAEGKDGALAVPLIGIVAGYALTHLAVQVHTADRDRDAKASERMHAERMRAAASLTELLRSPVRPDEQWADAHRAGTALVRKLTEAEP